jgi:hypothetical protein
VSEFRSLTGSYRKNKISGDDYVNKIIALADNNVDNCSKIFRGVEELLDIEEKKWEVIRIWRNKQTEVWYKEHVVADIYTCFIDQPISSIENKDQDVCQATIITCACHQGI